MTDLHTHILPGIDDGAKSVEESLAMLRMEYNQGVDTVVLTPHFYRDRENPKTFLARRKEAAAKLANRVLELSEQEQKQLPRMILGAEVAWWPGLTNWEELPDLCIGNTKAMLVELPFTPWNDRMIHDLYELFGRAGITPVIAHLERYLKIQHPEYIQELLNLGASVQVSSDILLRPIARGGAINLLKRRQAHIVASDCHDCIKRPPNVSAGLDVVRKKLGEDSMKNLIRCGDELVEN